MCHELIRQLSNRILTFDDPKDEHSLRRPTLKLCKAFPMAVRKAIMLKAANRDEPPFRIRHWPDGDRAHRRVWWALFQSR